jgi:hypothetical protein
MLPADRQGEQRHRPSGMDMVGAGAAARLTGHHGRQTQHATIGSFGANATGNHRDNE